MNFTNPGYHGNTSRYHNFLLQDHITRSMEMHVLIYLLISYCPIFYEIYQIRIVKRTDPF